jgi:hypothetical protein
MDMAGARLIGEELGDGGACQMVYPLLLSGIACIALLA